MQNACFCRFFFTPLALALLKYIYICNIHFLGIKHSPRGAAIPFYCIIGNGAFDYFILGHQIKYIIL